MPRSSKTSRRLSHTVRLIPAAAEEAEADSCDPGPADPGPADSDLADPAAAALAAASDPGHGHVPPQRSSPVAEPAGIPNHPPTSPRQSLLQPNPSFDSSLLLKCPASLRTASQLRCSFTPRSPPRPLQITPSLCSHFIHLAQVVIARSQCADKVTCVPCEWLKGRPILAKFGHRPV